MQYSTTTYNSVVTYTCEEGYTLQGSNNRTCQSSGQWTGSVPQCNRELAIWSTLASSRPCLCCPHVTICYINTPDPTHHSDILTFVSSPAVDCGDPGNLTNGRRILSSTTYNSVVGYTCDVGYTLQGSMRRTCLFNEQWSGSLPQCLREHLFVEYNCKYVLEK